MKVGKQDIAGDKGDDDGDGRGKPDQVRQGLFQIKLFFADIKRGIQAFIDEIGRQRGQDHENPHGEDPDDERSCHIGISRQRQGQEGDQGHAGYPVCFKTIRSRPDAVAGIVARAVGDNAGIFRVILGQVKDDLHEVRSDVGNLGEDTAADPQSAGAERFANGKADKAGSGQFLGQKNQDADHEEKFHADE